MIHCGLGIMDGRNGWWDRLSAFAFAALRHSLQHAKPRRAGSSHILATAHLSKSPTSSAKNDKIGQTHFIISRPLHLLYLGRRHPLKGVEYLEAAVRQIQDSTRSTCSTRLKIDLRIVSNAFGEEKEMIK